LLAAAIPACQTLPRQSAAPPSHSLPAANAGPLASTAAKLARSRSPGESSFLLLEDNREALDWRLALIDSATTSIDIQVYMVLKDDVARLALTKLLDAADRGVRVRLLADGFFNFFSQDDLAVMSHHHPSLEVRLFNPPRFCGGIGVRVSEYLAHPGQLDRRMHNKTFTVDRRFTIIGGRNITRSDFGYSALFNNHDLDVLAAGPVVGQVAAGFDQYWNSSLAAPLDPLAGQSTPEALARLRRRLDRHGELATLAAKSGSDWAPTLANACRKMQPGRARFAQDPPEGQSGDRPVVRAMRGVVAGSRNELLAVTPYCLPSCDEFEPWRQAAARGIPVSLLVPSQEACSHILVHAPYRRHRPSLLASGLRLCEARGRPDADLRTIVHADPTSRHRTALHMKAIVSDRQRSLVGSINLDPRSLEINTECAFIIDSPAVGKQLASTLERAMDPSNAWELKSAPDGRLRWHGADGIRTREPSGGLLRPLATWITGQLRIERQTLAR
jgi:putative cardiolipin synthase